MHPLQIDTMRLKMREIGYFLLFWDWFLHLSNSSSKMARFYITPSIRYKKNKILKEIWSNLMILSSWSGYFLITSRVSCLKFRFFYSQNVTMSLIIWQYILNCHKKSSCMLRAILQKAWYMPRDTLPNFNSFGIDLEVALIDFWVKNGL